MNYEPENWRRRGYLESWVPVFPGQGERWLVIFTRPQDLAGQTVLESGDALKVIPHIETGEIGVTILDE